MSEKKEKKEKKAKKTEATKTKSVKASAASKTKLKSVKPIVEKSAEKTKTKRKGKAEANTDAKPVVVISHDQISQKAYEIWLAKGKPHGQDHQNWIEAKAALEKMFS